MANEEESATIWDTVRGRWRFFTALGVLAALAIGCWQLWQVVGQRVAADPHYRVTATSIETTPPPAWVRSDIRSEVFARTGMDTGLSALDPPEKLEARLADAFAFHPWVKSVGRIAKQPPNRLRIELEYRVPLAAVGHAAQPGVLLLADSEAFRLPEADLTAAELRHLPRVTLPSGSEQAGKPLLGERWADARVQGAVAIVAALGEKWWDLQLADITLRPQLEVRGASRFWVYELVSQGGTRVVWGAAPFATPPGEPAFQDKLARLVAFVQANGPLSGDRSPASIDVRAPRMQIEPRTAKETSVGDEVLK